MIGRAAAIVFVSTALLSGCAQTHIQKYHRAVSTNAERLRTVEVGMSRQQVESIMGTGAIVSYKKVDLRNPWRSETWQKDGHRFDALYYVSSGQTWSKFQKEEELLTPVVFEDGKVVGSGWALVDRTPRYVSGPYEAR